MIVTAVPLKYLGPPDEGKVTDGPVSARSTRWAGISGVEQESEEGLELMRYRTLSVPIRSHHRPAPPMPLVRIDLRSGRPPEFRRALGDAVYQAMHEAANVPAGDRFIVVTEHDADGLQYDPAYLGVARTDDVISIQITLNAGRTLEVKKALYARIAERLAALGVRREDVFVSLVEVVKENWSFGNGVAQYAE